MSVLARVGARPPVADRFSDFARNAALIRELAWTQFKLKYTGSVLGYLWSLLKPAMLFSIMYAIFVVLFKQRAHEFAVQLLVGIVIFTFFTECTGTAMSSIAGNPGLIQKAFFPRWVLVVASSMTAAMTFVINLTLIVVVAAPLGHLQLGLRSLFAIPLVLELYVLSLGLSLLLASLFVFYRDLGHIWEILTQVIFYASGIVYPITLVPVRFHGLFFINPVAQIIEDVRHVIVVPDAASSIASVHALAAVPVALSIGLLVLGLFTFRWLSPTFAESL
ncbi:MAG: ABC transporter permease [Candidatus Dormibacteria bacterium]